MGTSFQRRAIRITFRLATGAFNGEGEPDTITIPAPGTEGSFRCMCEIEANGGTNLAKCVMQIFGLDQFVMDRLSVLNYFNLDFMRNVVSVEVSDGAGGFSQEFLGEVFICQQDYSGAPEVALKCEAMSGIIGMLAPSFSTSYPGAQKVSVIMGELAKELGLELENNGVEATITDQYLSGSPLQKVQMLAAATRTQYWYLPEQGVLSIAPMGSARAGEPTPVNLNRGLVGWPTKTHIGVEFTTLYNPALRHGTKVLLESDIPACNGEWYIISITSQFTVEAPDGVFFQRVVATPELTTIRIK